MDSHAPRTTPIQRDVAVLLGGLLLVVLASGFAVAFGFDLAPGAGGFAPWAVALLVGAVVAFAVSAWYWYYVHPDEREPARGEWTHDAGTGMHRREGGGSFRTKALHANAAGEAHHRMEAERDFVPRTGRAWATWVLAVIGALATAVLLIRAGDRSGDPFAFQLTATALIAVALVMGAMLAGEFGHSGRWTRARPPGERPPG